MSSIPDSSSAPPQALVQAWRADRPSPGELQRGYAQFLRVQAPRRRAPVLARWLVIGLICGTGLAQAASAVFRHFSPQTQAVRAPEPPRGNAASKHASQPQPVPAASGPAGPADLPQLAPEPVPSAGTHTRARSLERAPAPSSSSAAAAEVARQWQGVAGALRANDATGAEVNLLELERTTSGSEREAAQLARAQLLASQGRSSEALAVTSELEQRSTSSVVRSKARTLAARLQKSSEQNRSLPSPPAMKNEP